MENTDQRLILGIDPGITGGIVCIDGEGFFASAARTPSIQGAGKRDYDVQGMADLIREALSTSSRVMVGIEKVGAMPRDGRVGAFSFGKGYGLWLGILAGMRVPYLEVMPQRWQAKMLAGLPRGPRTKTSAVQRCKALFPMLPIKVKADWGMADAALIAEYTRLVRT